MRIKAEPEIIDILQPAAELTLHALLPPKTLRPFIQQMVRKGVSPDQWPSLIPFWLLSLAYEGIDVEAVTILEFIPRRLIIDEVDACTLAITLKVSYAGYTSAKPCGFCAGRGLVLNNVCEACGGIGKVLRENARCNDPACGHMFFTAPYRGKGWDKCPACGGIASMVVRKS